MLAWRSGQIQHASLLTHTSDHLHAVSLRLFSLPLPLQLLVFVWCSGQVKHGSPLPALPRPLPLPLQLLVFVWRSGQIKDKSSSLYDDRRGPLGLAGIIIAALSLIFVVALADFVRFVRHHGDAPPSPPSPPAAAAAAVGQAAEAATQALGGLLSGGGGGAAAATHGVS